MRKKPIEILVVEDDPAEARLLWEALKKTRAPYHVHLSPTGSDALDFLFQCGSHSDAPCPDLVLLDLNLPGKNGHDVLRAVKGRPETRQIPVIIMSGSHDRQDIQEAYGSYANCYVKKPSNLDELVRVMQAIEMFWFESATLPRR